jgi:putative FmdB family regulatory protein
MITYDYICTSCDHTWEEQQNITDEKIKICPRCNNETAQRQISGGTGFVLQGGGWASAGYHSK